MFKMGFICFLGLAIGLLAEQCSEKDRKTGEYIRKNVFFFVALVLVAGSYVGLRTSYNDTYDYILGFNSLSPTGELFDGMNWALGENPGFWTVSRILRHLGASSQDFLLLFAITTMSIYVWFIRKYTTNIILTVFLFMFVSGYSLLFTAVKQSFAIALCLVATDRFLKGKKSQFVFFVLLAATFHPYSVMYFIIPLLADCPWNKRTYIMIGLSLVVGMAFPFAIELVLGFTDSIGESYTSDSFSGAGVNPFRVLVAWAPIVIAFAKRKQIFEIEDKAYSLFMNLYILSACIMFLALFGTANYIGRLSSYFSLFLVIAFPWVLGFYKQNERRNLTVLAVMCYALYFAYGYGVAGENFDEWFKQVEAIDYLKSLFSRMGGLLS